MTTWISKKRRQQRMLEMSALTNPSLFYYKGPIEGFELKLSEVMSNPSAQITDVHVVIVGLQTKDTNCLCCCLTVLLSILFVIPWAVMCCQWWTKMVEPAYEVHSGVYQKLMAFISRPGINSFNMEVQDNNFNAQKAKLIFDTLSRTDMKSFSFYNSASNIDYKEEEFSNFVQRMKPIKMLPVNAYIRWYNVVVS